MIVDVCISETNIHGRTFWKKCFKKDDEILEVSNSVAIASVVFILIPDDMVGCTVEGLCYSTFPILQL